MLSRRDLRTQPGVSTPGTHQHHDPALPVRRSIGNEGRRRKGAEEIFNGWLVRSTSAPEQRFCRPREALRSRPRPRIRPPRSDGVLECWSTAPIWNCTPHARGWECFQGGTPFLPYLGLKPQAESFHPFGISPTGPVGHGMIGSERHTLIRTTNQPWVRIRLSTGRILDRTCSRQCYDHSVPPGQRRSAPIRPIAVSLLVPPGQSPRTPYKDSNRCQSRSKDDHPLIPRISWIFFQAAFRLLS